MRKENVQAGPLLQRPNIRAASNDLLAQSPKPRGRLFSEATHAAFGKGYERWDCGNLRRLQMKDTLQKMARSGLRHTAEGKRRTITGQPCEPCERALRAQARSTKHEAQTPFRLSKQNYIQNV